MMHIFGYIKYKDDNIKIKFNNRNQVDDKFCLIHYPSTVSYMIFHVHT